MMPGLAPARFPKKRAQREGYGLLRPASDDGRPSPGVLPELCERDSALTYCAVITLCVLLQNTAQLMCWAELQAAASVEKVLQV